MPSAASSPAAPTQDASSSTTAPAAPTGRTAGPPWRTLVELVVAIAVAAVVSVGVQGVMSRLVQVPFPSQVPSVLVAAGSLVGAVALLALVARWPGRRRERAARVAVWAGLSALLTWALALPLVGTRWYYAGIGVDQSFRTQILTRYTASPAWADGTYAGLPPFYPPTWFWLGGRLAALAGLPGWQVYKPWAVLTMAVAPVAATVLWGVVVRRPVAALLGIATLVVGLRAGSGEPYAFILVACVVPVVVIAWRALAVDGPRRRWTLLGTGVFLGLCAAVYTLYLGFTAMVVVLVALVGLRAMRRAGVSTATAVRETVLRLLLVAVPAAVLGLAVWGPYLLAAVRAGFPAASAPRYLPDLDAPLPLPMLEFSPIGVLCALGTAWVVVAARRDPVARALAATVVGVYLWYLLSALALVAATTLLAFRLDPVLLLALSCAGVLGGVELVRRVPALVGERWRPTARAGALVAGTALLVALVQPTPEGMGDPENVSYTQAYPTGRAADGRIDPADEGSWTPGVVAAISRTDPRPPGEVVVLGGAAQLYAAEPYHGFQATLDQYANPLADYDARNALIADWSRAPDAAALRTALDTAPYPPPTTFVLVRAADGLHLTLSRDQFPQYPNEVRYDVVFPPALFDAPWFAVEQVGPFTVATRR